MSASPVPRLRLALGAALLPLLFTGTAPAHDAPGEYFFGADPGVGEATPLPLGTPSPALAEIHDFALPLPASPGAGLVLGLRFRNPAGQWGATTVRHLYLLQSLPVNTVEWTWDGAFASTPPDATPTDGAFALPRPALPPVGAPANRLALRARAGGLVGFPSFRQISPFGGSAPSRLYYALDHGPDPTTAAFIALTADHALVPVAVPLPLGGITPGFHSLHLQLHDAKGIRTETIRFLHVIPATVQTLTGLAYTFRNAEGTATTLSVAPITPDSAAQDVTLPVPASLARGDYTLVLNLADSAADLGFASTSSLQLRPNYEAWAAVAFAGLAPEAAAMLADPDGDQIVNLLEYAFALNPRLAETTPPYVLAAAGLPAGTTITLHYRQREGGSGILGRDYSVDGLRYVVEATTDLQNWHPFDEIDGIGAHRSHTTNGDGTETVAMELFIDPLLAAQGRVFVRLNISLLP